MKKIILAFKIILFAGAITACEKETIGKTDTTPAEKHEVQITATVEQPQTRSTLASDGVSVLWSAKDSLIAFGEDGTRNLLILTEGSGTGKGTFSGTLAGGEPYTLLYPYSDKASIDGGWLEFELPHEQTHKSNTFAEGSNPAIATCSDGGAAQFRNLCSILKVTIKGKGQQLSRIVLQDLAGNMLWGKASVKLDGKQGSDLQEFTLAEGDNTLCLNMTNVTINATNQKTFYFVVPAGTLDGGFTLAFHTIQGKVFGFTQTQVGNTPQRSEIVNMPTATTSTYSEPSDTRARGYYKDLFMDSGLSLTSRKTLPAAELLGYEMEYFASNATSSLTAEDTLMQSLIMEGSDEDPNGVLLYPDGEPRFRAIYVNGGNATSHGRSLYSVGIEKIKTFVANGGSYTGSCAGSFFASKGAGTFPNKYYSGIWPGRTYTAKTDGGTTLQDVYIRLTPEPGCPLLKYYDLGSRIDGVYHNGGSYIKPNDSYWPAGTEVLMRYYTPGADSTNIHGCVNSSAYKASKSTGRVIMSGSHPEGKSSGTQLYYMAAMLAYAADGSGDPDIKTFAGDGTASGVLGDKQYHHYKFASDGTSGIQIELSSKADVNLILTLNNGDLAWMSDARYVLASDGASKKLTIKNLEAGQWYVGVYCATSVTATKTKYSSSGEYFKYSGHTEVLEGIGYNLIMLPL